MVRNNNALYEKLSETMKFFNFNDFSILQLSSVSDKALALPETLQKEMVSFFSNPSMSNDNSNVLFTPSIGEEKVSFFQKPTSIYTEFEQKILFNIEQTKQLFSALEQQAKSKGFVKSFFNRKLQSKIDALIKNSDDTFVEMELVRKLEENSKPKFLLNISAYDEDAFDNDLACIPTIEIPLDVYAVDYVEEIDSQFKRIVEYNEKICTLLEEIEFSSQDLVENEVGYFDKDESKKNIVGYVVKGENETKIIPFNTPLQQLEYEVNMLNRNRVLEIVARKEVTEGRNDIASRFIENGFFNQQQYSAMFHYALDNENPNVEEDKEVKVEGKPSVEAEEVFEEDEEEVEEMFGSAND
jgi:hypothetical protein